MWAPKGLIPLMAVLQANKQKVRLVMDYWELNKYVDAHTANADICVQKLREWWQKGSNVALLDLCRAYLQVHIDKSLWPFQTVRIKGQRYCLTRSTQFKKGMVTGFTARIQFLLMESRCISETSAHGTDQSPWKMTVVIVHLKMTWARRCCMVQSQGILLQN